MKTVFDWITVAAFSVLIVMFLDRSLGPDDKRDSMLHYAVPAGCCAVANYLGNEISAAAAVLVLVGGALYAYYFLIRRAPHRH